MALPAFYIKTSLFEHPHVRICIYGKREVSYD